MASESRRAEQVIEELVNMMIEHIARLEMRRNENLCAAGDR